MNAEESLLSARHGGLERSSQTAAACELEHGRREYMFTRSSKSLQELEMSSDKLRRRSRGFADMHVFPCM